jgi:hypothetical protein
MASERLAMIKLISTLLADKVASLNSLLLPFLDHNLIIFVEGVMV